MANAARAQALGSDLRAHRKRAGLSLDRAAEIAGLSRAKVGRIELAEQGITEADVSALLVALGVSKAEKDRLQRMARQLDEPAWWEVHTGVTSQLASLIYAEQQATCITYVTPTVVPGLLQTRAYTRAVYEAAGLSDEQIDEAVAVRQHRQGILERSSPVELVVYMDESVLLRPVGGAETAAEQLRYIIKVNERANISVRVLPLALGMHVGLDGMFSVLDMSNGNTTVHVETRNAGAMLDEEPDVRPFKTTIRALSEVALDYFDTSEMLAGYLKQHEGSL
ncbi:Helix-turn-helix domain-containing protein [Actinopolyspora mzabensis]|uniref:Helix-turn-helix domain-containing protein n=1 Tax=Actinopolyspora mzabensis TaxID=995066 RepID=A0A1G9CDZ9_ACTMZ|nr:helix-turn-helix transcriptional regulator [Actinopolyspora mzabensis]SDK49665.1 Helix-turn-helix domain-containing protein [Actinopolyspora mzabensis]